MSISEPLQRLVERLPELEWSLRRCPPKLNSSVFPKGLFRSSVEMTPAACINEIKFDLQLLQSKETTERCQFYLAQLIEKKIHALVRISHKNPNEKTADSLVFGTVEAITTRQQWLNSLEENFLELTRQHEALLASVLKARKKNEVDLILRLEQECEEARQALAQAESVLERSYDGRR